MTTNKSVECSNAPQETATDCSYVGLQAIMSTVGLFANKYIALNQEWNITGNYAVRMHKTLMCPLYKHVDRKRVRCVAASGVTIWTSTYGLEPVLCNRLLIEPSGWAQTLHMFTQRCTQHVTQYSRRSLNAFFYPPFCACIYNLAEPYLISFRQ